MSGPDAGGAVAGRRVVLLGADGTVGRWYRTHLLAGADTVTTAGLGAGADHRGDARTPGAGLREAVAAADEVVLALPEDVAAACLGWLAGCTGPGTVVVSTCSVQLPLFEAASQRGLRAPLRGVNPMFSPTLPSAGQSVVVIAPDGEADAHVRRTRTRLEAGSMTVSVMDPAGHDAAMSVLQALPHAAVLSFVDALLAAPVDVPTLMRIAPPPARTLVALACRILAAPPEIYWDIQRANALGGERRKELSSSLLRLDALVEADRADDFRAALASAARGLGPYAAEGAEECRELFELIQRRRTARRSAGGGAPG
ncbi:prephenate dehydrogenase/arogenate dehydrogenase family protein [Streptomyces sp. NBC_00704]|uniref:prephenate dehydrogenase dimerization domain-containing protein n=1 Tax=Streptomyces sp. NBC_00704 TaxID=2975809 RepID=UPI002E358714|nr:prephenate dehydrogenase dimerization domain-containing protein [Streptomyces sp. NBC_00704]